MTAPYSIDLRERTLIERVLVALMHRLSVVMPGLVPGTHVLLCSQDVGGRDKPGHDAHRLVPCKQNML